MHASIYIATSLPVLHKHHCFGTFEAGLSAPPHVKCHGFAANEFCFIAGSLSSDTRLHQHSVSRCTKYPATLKPGHLQTS